MPRPRGRPKTARLTVNLDSQAYGVLLAIAHKHDAPLAWVIRRAVTDLITKEELSEPDLPFVRSTAPLRGPQP